MTADVDGDVVDNGEELSINRRLVSRKWALI